MSKDIPDGVYASAEALDLHADLIVFDCVAAAYLLEPAYHERALAGGVTATNVTMASEGQSWDEVLRRIENAHQRIEDTPELMLATTAGDVREAKRTGRLAIILGTQGSGVVDTNLSRVGTLHRLGIRYIGLAYTGATLLADGCGETRDAGLTFLGKEFIDVVNELHLILDLSHTGHRSRLEAAELATYPVCTHSNAYAVNPNDRNTKDDAARVIAEKGGIVGVTGLVRSVAPDNATIEHMLDHTDHWADTIGADHTGIGLDFVEAYQEEYQRGGASVRKPSKWRTLRPDIFGTGDEFYTLPYPRGLHSVRLLPNFTHGLLDRGYSPGQIRDIMGESWLRNLEFATG